MSQLLTEHTLQHMEKLVGYDTRMSRESSAAPHPIFSYLMESLEGFSFEDLCFESSRGLWAWRGDDPKLLFCVHLNTVHDNELWTQNPFELKVRDGLATGLGVCDCKSGVAALLTAFAHSKNDIAVLFTLDSNPRSKICVTHFLESSLHARHSYDFVCVVEPTRSAAVLEHRGLVMCKGYFNGVSGHAAQMRALVDSATHEATRWSIRALDYASEQQRHIHYEGLHGICFNLGMIEGGASANLIAEHAVVSWAIRPLPTQDPMQIARKICELASRPWRVKWEYSFVAPTLPSSYQGTPGSARVSAARDYMARRSVFIGPPTDFWTTAALFSDHGYAAAALGPGHIVQSNTPDEWVRLNEIEQSVLTYIELIEHA